jgi:hypothetical protein
MRTERICRIEDDGTKTPMVLEPAVCVDGVRLTPDDSRVVCEALGLMMPATMHHDAGAAAFCSRCKRYTTDLRALRSADDPTCPVCDCGEKNYWTGSFVRPTKESQWSLP